MFRQGYEGLLLLWSQFEVAVDHRPLVDKRRHSVERGEGIAEAAAAAQPEHSSKKQRRMTMPPKMPPQLGSISL